MVEGRKLAQQIICQNSQSELNLPILPHLTDGSLAFAMIKVLVEVRHGPCDRSEAVPFPTPLSGPDFWACTLYSYLEPYTLKGSMFGLMPFFCQLEILNNFWTRRFTFSLCTELNKLCSWYYLMSIFVVLCYSSGQLLNCVWILSLFASWSIISSGFAKICEAPTWVIFNSPCALNIFNYSLLLTISFSYWLFINYCSPRF